MDTDHDKIIRVEEKLNALAVVVDKIATNEPVHISNDVRTLHDKIDSINVKLAIWSGGIIVAVWAVERFIK